MQLKEFLPKLRNVQASGSNHTARCPAHNDKQNSLSISNGDKGIVIHCHAGCTPESVMLAIGLTLSDLFYEEPANSKVKQEIERIYDYVDLDC